MQLLRPTLQILFFSLALYTGLTRISDYKHHWSDVFAGAVLGAAVAMFSVCRKSSFSLLWFSFQINLTTLSHCASRAAATFERVVRFILLCS